jgi:hypothetical protein
MLLAVYGVHVVFLVRGFLRSAFMLFLIYGVHVVFPVRDFLRSAMCPLHVYIFLCGWNTCSNKP